MKSLSALAFAILSASSVPAVAAEERSLKKTYNCAAGQFPDSNAGGVCTDCVPGTASKRFYEDTAASCPVCPGGLYQPASAQSKCLKCPTGSAAVGGPLASNHLECVACPPGSAARPGKKCTVCPAGTYANAAQTNCIKCPVGTFNPLTGQTSDAACTVCPVPNSVTHRRGAKAESECIACDTANNQFADKKKGKCTTCPGGSHRRSHEHPEEHDGGDDGRYLRRLKHKRHNRDYNGEDNSDDRRECVCDAGWFHYNRNSCENATDTEDRTPVASPDIPPEDLLPCGEFCGTAYRLIPCSQSLPVVEEYIYPKNGLCIGADCLEDEARRRVRRVRAGRKLDGEVEGSGKDGDEFADDEDTATTEVWVVEEDASINKIGLSYYVSGDDITINGFLECADAAGDAYPANPMVLDTATDVASETIIGAPYEIFLSKWLSISGGSQIALSAGSQCQLTVTFSVDEGNQATVLLLADGDQDSFDFGAVDVEPCPQ